MSSVHAQGFPYLELLVLLVYYSLEAAAPTSRLRVLETDAKDKSTEIGSPGFKPLDARAVGEPEAVRIGRTTYKQLLGSIQGSLGKPGSASLRVSNFE